MKVSITYFYNIRFFKEHQIPLSTAIWDPKWYHNGLGNNEIFLDKNGVLNGLRCEELNPESCQSNGCPCIEKDYKTCSFLKNYKEGLRRVDFTELMNKFSVIAEGWIKLINSTEEPEIVLIVYETPNNPCSERAPIIEWFLENGVIIKEWERCCT